MGNSSEQFSEEKDSFDFTPLVFVGENRSNMAQTHDWSWERCQIERQPRNCAKQLFEALEYCGIDPYNIENVRFLNAWEDNQDKWVAVEDLDIKLRTFMEDGFGVVSLGEHVHQYLEVLEIPHIRLIHPAARGEIRKKERYQRHVAETLLTN